MKYKSYIFFAFFLIITQLFYGYDLNITLKDSSGNALEGVTVNIYKKELKSNLAGEVEFEDLDRYIDVFIKSSLFRDKRFKLDLEKSQKVIVFLEDEGEQFKFNLIKGEDFAYRLSNSYDSSAIHLSNAIVNLYSNNDLLISFDYIGKGVPIDIPKGVYDIEIFTLFAPPFNLKKIPIDIEKYKYINITLPIELSKVEGRVMSNNSYLGGVELKFEDNSGKVYNFSTDFSGYFKGELPPNLYTLNIMKNGYSLKGEGIYDFSNNNIIYKPIIELTENPSYIEGRVLDTLGNPLANTKLEIKNNGREFVVYTDMQGRYNAEVERGLVFVKANKKGFYPSGKIERVEAFSTKKISDIRIQERLSSLAGTVTNGITPLIGVNISLYEKDGYFVASTKSSDTGTFTFENLKITKEYYLAVNSKRYLPYKSELFTNEEKVRKNIDIILNDNSINFVIELSSSKSRELEGVEVFVNNLNFNSDLNGIVNDMILSESIIEELEVEIPKYNINRTYKVEELGAEPYLIKINID